MHNRNNPDNQAMRTNYHSFPTLPPPPITPIQFDPFHPIQDSHYYDTIPAPIHWSTFNHISTLNFNTDYTDYTNCARMDIYNALKPINSVEIDAIPPSIDNAQIMQPNYSFCSEVSNNTQSTVDTFNDGRLWAQPPPQYRFQNFGNYNNEDDTSLSSVSHQSRSPLLNVKSDIIKTEMGAPNVMSLNDTKFKSVNNTKNKKNTLKPFVCPECFNRYKYKSSMKLHYKVHTSEAKVCKECGKKFPHQHKLKIHMRSHTGERPYKCDLCVKAFSDKSNLNRHKRLHTGEKPYECEFCLRRYSDSSALVDHRRRKHTKEKPYKCQFCAKTFAASSDLTSHLAVHSNVRPFECDQCQKRFKRRSDVHKHMRTHQPKAERKKKK